MSHDAQAWMELALKDMTVAKYLYTELRPMQTEIICVHCQQAAEKAVKALRIASPIAGGVPKTHDISLILSHMKNMLDIPEHIWDAADHLTSYGLSMRYPSDIIVSEEEIKTLLHQAESIVDWAESTISLFPSVP